MNRKLLPCIRADQWAWFMRLSKTRSEAGKRIRAGKLKRNNQTLKPSHLVQPGDELHWRCPGGFLVIRIIAIPAGRISAKEKSLFLEILSTPPPQEKQTFTIRNLNGRYALEEHPTDPDADDWDDFLEEWKEWEKKNLNN